MPGGLIPRIRPRLEQILADGVARCDRDLVGMIHCNRRAVQRVLEKMHKEGLVHIASWAKAGRSYRYRPEYILGPGADAEPPPLTGRDSTRRVQAFRARMNADDKAFADARRRQKRRVIKRDPLTAAFFGGG